MHFEFATATRIVFGAGALKQVGALARPMGDGALIVTGRSPSRAQQLREVLALAGLRVTEFAVAGEPTIQVVEAGTALARNANCGLVIGFGGGSAIDAGKAIAAMLTNPGDLLEYLEVIGAGKTLENPCAPFIAIPTTAGTGSEVTRNAVLGSPSHRVKVSLRSPLMLPRIALVDPELTLDLPPALTASTGLDALTQLIEPYVCSRPNALIDPLCAEGIQRVARSLRRAFHEPHDLAAREDMSLASLFGGLALANAGLGGVHGIAGPLGGMFPAAPHGAVCAALLPHVVLTNIRALEERQPAGPTLARYAQIASWLTGNTDATPAEGVHWLEQLIAELRIPRLSSYGLTPQDTPALVEKALHASSMKANPLPLTSDEIASAILAAL